MKKMVKVYDVKKFIEEGLKEKNVTTFCHDDVLAIITNEQGLSFVINEEGVYYILNVHDDYEIDLVDLPKELENGIKTFAIMPQYSAKLPLQELVDKCEYKEMYLQDHIRTFGDRLERNYCNIIKDITDTLGLDGRAYDNGRMYQE